MGFYGYSLGPDYIIIDKLGLTDPFLSKLPIFGDFQCHNWRVGHYERQISQQYLSSVIQGKNNFKNDSLGILYEAIKEITQGDIFSKKRLREIININAGKYKQHALSVLRKKEFDYPLSDFKLMNGITEVSLDSDGLVKTIATNINDYLFIYGPYVGLDKGKFEVNFHINGSSLMEDSAVIELDVFEYGSINPTLAQTQILGKELTLHGSNQYQLIIDNPEHWCDVEFRLRQLAPAQIMFKGVSVRKLE